MVTIVVVEAGPSNLYGRDFKLCANVKGGMEKALHIHTISEFHQGRVSNI